MYDSRQQLELPDRLARDRPAQARSKAASRSRPWVLQLLMGSRERLPPAPPRHAAPHSQPREHTPTESPRDRAGVQQPPTLRIPRRSPMHLRNHLPILATTATLAATSCPAAYASNIGQGGGGLPPVLNQPTARSPHSTSTDWTLMTLASGGTVALAAAGLGGARRLSRRQTAASQVRALHVG